MTAKLNIDKLARECGLDEAEDAETMPPSPLWVATPDQLTAYTRRVMEACALACWPDPIPDSIRPYDQGRIDCRDAIREMMP